MESDVTTVRADARYNPTGITVTAGQTIRVTAPGEWEDWGRIVDANGYEKTLLRPFTLLRRVRSAPWFRLCGAIGASEAHLFPLGNEASHVAPASGPLYLFANDLWAMYWNNSGELEVSVVVSD